MSNSVHMPLRCECSTCGDDFLITDAHVSFCSYNESDYTCTLHVECPMCDTMYKCVFSVYADDQEII